MSAVESSTLSTAPSRRLVALMVCLVVALTVTVGAAWRVEAEIARASDRLDWLRTVVGTTTDLHTETVELTSVAVAYGAGGRPLEEVEVASSLQRRQLAVARDDLIALGSARIVDLLAELDVALERLAQATDRLEPELPAIADAADAVAVLSRRLFDEADDQLVAAENDTEVSLGTIIVAGVFGIVSLVLAAMLALTMRRELARNVARAQERLDAEDSRRRHAERMALGQAEVLELIASGQSTGDVRRAIADLMAEHSGGAWSTDESAIVLADDRAESVDPERQAEAEAIAWRLLAIVEERDRAQSELTRRATHDVLTGLVNRAVIVERIERVVRRRHEPGRCGAVLFVDLDRFKHVNDSLGHDAGDELLCEVAERIRSTLRGEDTAGRVGGDEFVVVLDDSDADDAVRIGQRLVAAIERPIELRAGVAEVGVSVGVALTDGEFDPVELLGFADAAMYVSKSGTASVTLFDEGMREGAVARKELANELRIAIELGMLEVYFQPLIDASTTRIRGVEALVRWRREDGFVPPPVFIELAEEHGLIMSLDRFVLWRAASIVAGWNERLEQPLELAVNVSGSHLAYANVVDDIRAAIDATHLEPGCLTIEITEGVLLSDVDEVAGRLASLRRLGVRVAVDDFGTGYSSLSYLDRLPVDIVKIDRAFVKRIDDASEDDALVRAVVGLAEAMGLETVAEGVETPSQADRLVALGCDVLQGYLFDRPMPAEQLEQTWILTAQASTTSTSA